jgi:hypothetical protein
LDTKKLNQFLKKLNEDKGINDNIEEIRGKINNNIQYSEGQINDDGINIKTIKKTKNNPDSSRSILCYELIINKDGQKIPFIICDLPGKEKIIDSFGKEGEGLLKINKNNNNQINDEFLNKHFGNILKKLDEQLKPDKIKKIFKEIDNEINKTIDNNNITITYELLTKIEKFSGNFNAIFDDNFFEDREHSIELKEIKIITSDNNNNDNVVRIKNLIANIPDLLTFNQKKKGNNFNKFTNSENRIFSEINNNNYLEKSKLYIGFNEKYKDKIEITEKNNNSNGINFTFIDDDIIKNIKINISNINVELKSQKSEQSKQSQKELLNNIRKGILEKNDNKINFFISDANLIELEKIANQKLNKKRLIEAMNNAIDYVSTNQTKQPHPILKLTQILDEINDEKYMKNYVTNAEKCFRYTKAAEGIFINENINGIIQLLSDKKGLSNSDNNNQDNSDYKEEKMYYNQKINNSNSFNNTIIYEKLYDIYEKKTSNDDNINKLRKIDNMYAFFVVANISKNERIKQKLICNATKTKQGYRTEQDLGWVCDQEEVDKKNKEKEEKEKEEKNKIIKYIEEEIREIINQKTKQVFQLLIVGDKNKMGILLEIIEKLNNNLNKIDNYNIDNYKIEFKINDDRKKKQQEQQEKNSGIKLLNYMSRKEKKINMNDIENLKEKYIEKLTNKIYDEYMEKNMIEENIKPKPIDQENINNNFERELYIREMCKTQIALFRELENKINQINKSEEQIL